MLRNITCDSICHNFNEAAPVRKAECENKEDQVLQHTALFARMVNSTLNSAVRKKKLSLHIQKVWLFIKAKRIFPHSYFQPWSDLQPVRWRQIIRDAYLAVTLVFRLLNVVQLLQSRGQPFTRQDKVLCVCWKYSSIMSICK